MEVLRISLEGRLGSLGDVDELSVEVGLPALEEGVGEVGGVGDVSPVVLHPSVEASLCDLLPGEPSLERVLEALTRSVDVVSGVVPNGWVEMSPVTLQEVAQRRLVALRGRERIKVTPTTSGDARSVE